MTTETELVTNGLVYHLCSLHSFGFVSVFGEMELSVMRGKYRKWQGSDCLQQDVELALEWDVGLVGLDGVIRRKKTKKKKLAFSFWTTNHGANLSNFGQEYSFP